MARKNTEPVEVDNDEFAGETLSENPTRPNVVTRRSAKRGIEVQRYTVDLDRNQRRVLAICAADWEVDKSRIIRTLLYLLEADESLRVRVERELFEVEEDEDA